MSTGLKQCSPSNKYFHRSKAHSEVLNTGPRLNRTRGIAPAAYTRPMILCLCMNGRVNWKLTELWVSRLFISWVVKQPLISLLWGSDFRKQRSRDLGWARNWLFFTSNINDERKNSKDDRYQSEMCCCKGPSTYFTCSLVNMIYITWTSMSPLPQLYSSRCS